MYKKKQRFYPAEAPAANANCETGDNAILSRHTINRYRPSPIVTAFIASLTLYGCGAGGGDGGIGIGGQDSDGAQRIAEAGKFSLDPEIDEADPASEPVTESDIPMGDYTATCTTEGWSESEVRTIVDTAGLDLDGTTLYPGALVRGSDFKNGTFVPITIPRSTGTIYLTGLNLEEGAPYTAGDIEMTGSSVNQAIQDLINDSEVQGTKANASYSESKTYSYEHMLFELGIDARYGSKSMELGLAIDTETARSNAFVNFKQVYYSVTYDDPETSVSVFRDGAGFQDPEGQISENSPPMYVSKVNYGRMVFFVAESTHDATEVAIALNGAVSGGSRSVEVDSGFTHQEVLENSNVSYYVVGGDAGLSLIPINAEDGADMFDKVKDFITDRKAANYSASTPGAPISYTLNYLADRTPARMSYSVTGDRQDCTYSRVEGPEPEPEILDDTRFRVFLQNLDDISWAEMEVNGDQCEQRTESSSKRWDVYKCLNAGQLNSVKIQFQKGLARGDSVAEMYVRNGSSTGGDAHYTSSVKEYSEGGPDSFYFNFQIDLRADPSLVVGEGVFRDDECRIFGGELYLAKCKGPKRYERVGPITVSKT